MNRTVICLLAAVAVGAAAFFGTQKSNKDRSVRDALIEAMTNDEGYIVDHINCYSESYYDLEASYIDCASCTSKDHRRGVGFTSKCSVIRQLP